MKYLTNRVVVLLILAADLSVSLSAQQVVGQVAAPALNGAMVNVPVVMTTGLGDIARAGNGVILVDPSLTMLPWEAQQFILGHEAGHVMGIMNEAGADAYAGSVLRMAGFTPAQMEIVYANMARLLCPWGDTTHPASAQRIAIVQASYNGV